MMSILNPRGRLQPPLRLDFCRRTARFTMIYLPSPLQILGASARVVLFVQVCTPSLTFTFTRLAVVCVCPVLCRGCVCVCVASAQVYRLSGASGAHHEANHGVGRACAPYSSFTPRRNSDRTPPCSRGRWFGDRSWFRGGCGSRPSTRVFVLPRRSHAVAAFH